MKEIHHILIPALFAFLGTLWIHPKVLKIAIMKNLVDNPDARKLQRNPVPVMGGIAVFFGILIVLWLIVINDSSINSFWGLWGVGVIPDLVAWPLTVFAAVGIINAVNLIDGVNGLSSGFCFMASTLFAIMFYYSGNTVMCTLAVSASGAIVPFFLHNVFGKSTKMFIGDGGTLVIGTMMSMFVISILDENSLSASYALKGMGLIPFTLAILAVPIFDTLRVMSTRMLHGSSPFHPDKTHLHHMFIDLGFSHVGTTVSILSLNFLIVASWFLSYKLGASVEVQLYIVLALSIMVTFVFYNFAKRQIAKQGKALVFFEKIAKSMQFEKKGIWEFAQKTIDKL